MNKAKLLFLGTGGVSDAVRLQLPAIELSKHDYSIKLVSLEEFRQQENYQRLNRVMEDNYACVLVSRPSSSKLMHFLKERNERVIVDMDDDFHSIPVHHPGYRSVGMGNPKFIGEIEECISVADGLIVTTEALKERWAPHQSNIRIIPNGWSKANPYWGMTSPRDTFNVGWGGTITHRIDFELIRKPLISLTREYPKICIVVAGDHKIYQQFNNVSEKNKLFLPMVQYKDYPLTIGYFDVMLAPVVDDAFNRAKSDIKLVDACASRIPFVASNVGEYAKWKEGGVCVSTEDTWYTTLESLYKHPVFYNHLQVSGWQYVQAREMSVLVHRWLEVLEN